jgi:hypothetical protein
MAATAERQFDERQKGPSKGNKQEEAVRDCRREWIR